MTEARRNSTFKLSSTFFELARTLLHKAPPANCACECDEIRGRRIQRLRTSSFADDLFVEPAESQRNVSESQDKSWGLFGGRACTCILIDFPECLSFRCARAGGIGGMLRDGPSSDAVFVALAFELAIVLTSIPVFAASAALNQVMLSGGDSVT
jgi:hypothetical protein